MYHCLLSFTCVAREIGCYFLHLFICWSNGMSGLDSSILLRNALEKMTSVLGRFVCHRYVYYSWLVYYRKVLICFPFLFWLPILSFFILLCYIVVGAIESVVVDCMHGRTFHNSIDLFLVPKVPYLVPYEDQRFPQYI